MKPAADCRALESPLRLTLQLLIALNVRTLLIACLLVGTAVGLGRTWARYGHAPERLVPDSAARPVLDERASPPRLEVDAREFDFGKIEQGGVARHAFTFTNHGPGVLKLTAGTTTCSACTIAAIEHDELKPGQSTSVTVQYDAKMLRSSFRQTATVLTNDPRQSRVELTISGKVIQQYLVYPDPVEFGNVSAGAHAEARTQLRYMLPGQLRIASHHFENADNAALFSLEANPLTPEQAERAQAASGYELVLSLKPGLPLGAFHQTIRLTLELPPDGKQAEKLVSLQGTIVSDFSIVGPGWRGDLGVLSLGTIRSNQGVTRKVTLLVRGADRDRVRVSVRRVDPTPIEVRLGERTPLSDSVDQIPLEIEVPAGLPPMIRLGTDQGPYGEIELGIENHPDIDTFPLKLRFAVQ